MLATKSIFLFGSALWLCMSGSTPAYAAASDACKSPILVGSPDVELRNLVMFPAASGTEVTVQVCIAVNKQQLADLYVKFAVFDQSGNFLSAGDKDLGPQSAIVGAVPNVPPIIAIGAAGLTLAAGQGFALDPTVLVYVQWTPCKLGLPTCVEDAAQSSTFLVNAASVPTAGFHAPVRSKRST